MLQGTVGVYLDIPDGNNATVHNEPLQYTGGNVLVMQGTVGVYLDIPDGNNVTVHYEPLKYMGSNA